MMQEDEKNGMYEVPPSKKHCENYQHDACDCGSECEDRYVKEETKLQSEQKTAEGMTVQEFSMLPLQAGLKITTSDGEGSYEGITSSGIVKVFINGGIKEYSWSEVTPKIMLRHVLMMEDLATKWKDLHSTPSTEQGSQEELWNDVDQNYIRWNDQEIKLSDLLKDFKINRK